MQLWPNLGDGSRARLIEYDLRLRSRVRRTVGPYYALALYRSLDETGQRVLAGKEGWLFLRGRAMLPEVTQRRFWFGVAQRVWFRFAQGQLFLLTLEIPVTLLDIFLHFF